MSTTINGATGAVADVKIAGVSYNAIFQDVTVTADVEQTDAATFVNEPDNAWEAGRTTLTVDLAGLLKKGAAPSGPLIPPPQNVALVVQYDAGCTLSFNVNFLRATARRIVNQLATMTGQARSIGALVKAWSSAGS